MFAKLGITAGLFCASLGLSGVAVAQTFEGTIDGKPQTWHVLTKGNESTVSISEQGPGIQMVVIQGHAEPSYAIKGTLTINVALMNGQPLASPDVMYFPGDKMLPSYTSDADAPGEFSIALKDETSQKVQVQGQYKGRLYLAEKIGQDLNKDKSIDVSVSFDLPALKMKQ